MIVLLFLTESYYTYNFFKATNFPFIQLDNQNMKNAPESILGDIGGI